MHVIPTFFLRSLLVGWQRLATDPRTRPDIRATAESTITAIRAELSTRTD